MIDSEKKVILTDSDKRKLSALANSIRQLSDEGRFVITHLEEVASALRRVMMSFSELEALSQGIPAEDLMLSSSKSVTDPLSSSIVNFACRRTDMVKAVDRFVQHVKDISMFGNDCPDAIFDAPLKRANNMFDIQEHES